MSRFLTCGLLYLCLATTIQAQVGFNNNNPDPSAILDLTANDKGLLVPRMTTAQREALTSNSPARSLLVFDTTEGRFYYFDGGQWYALNEWTRVAGSNLVSLNGSVSVNGSASITNGHLQVSGQISAATYAPTEYGNGPVPIGGIILWSGNLDNFETSGRGKNNLLGWALCNGQNGTPDLRERFVVGAGGGDNGEVATISGYGGPYSPHNKGGNNNNAIALGINQIPSHTHARGTLATSATGAHTHSFRSNGNRGSGGSGREPYGYGETTVGSIHATSSNGEHSHNITGSTGPAGGSPTQPFDNRPPYYALAYIMKILP